MRCGKGDADEDPDADEDADADADADRLWGPSLYYCLLTSTTRCTILRDWMGALQKTCIGQPASYHTPTPLSSHCSVRLNG